MTTPAFISAIITGLPQVVDGLEAFREAVGYYPKTDALRQPLVELETKYLVEEFVPSMVEGSHRAVYTGFRRDKEIKQMCRALIDDNVIDVARLEAVYEHELPRLNHEGGCAPPDLYDQVFAAKEHTAMMTILFTREVSNLVKQQLEMHRASGPELVG